MLIILGTKNKIKFILFHCVLMKIEEIRFLLKLYDWKAKFKLIV